MPYENIPLVIELYEHAGFGGKKIVIIADTDDLTYYGFNDQASSLKVFRGPTYENGWVVRLHERSASEGLGAYLEFAADQQVLDLIPRGFNDVASAVRFVKR